MVNIGSFFLYIKVINNNNNRQNNNIWKSLWSKDHFPHQKSIHYNKKGKIWKDNTCIQFRAN